MSIRNLDALFAPATIANAARAAPMRRRTSASSTTAARTTTMNSTLTNSSQFAMIRRIGDGTPIDQRDRSSAR